MLGAFRKYRQSMHEEIKVEEAVVNAEGQFLNLLESMRWTGWPANAVENPYAAALIVVQEKICDALKLRLKAARRLPLFDSSALQVRAHLRMTVSRSMLASNSELISDSESLDDAIENLTIKLAWSWYVRFSAAPTLNSRLKDEVACAP